MTCECKTIYFRVIIRYDCFTFLLAGKGPSLGAPYYKVASLIKLYYYLKGDILYIILLSLKITYHNRLHQQCLIVDNIILCTIDTLV